MEPQAAPQNDGRWERRHVRLTIPRQRARTMLDRARAWPVSRGGVFEADDDLIGVCVRHGDALDWFLRIHLRWDEPSPDLAEVWLVEWNLDIVEGQPELLEAISRFLQQQSLAGVGIA